MKITRDRVRRYALENGLEPLEEDGVPEGFLWKEPDITIGKQRHGGRVIKFKPLAEWDEGIEYGE